MGFTDDPSRVEDALRPYTSLGIAAGVLVPAILTLLPMGLLALYPVAAPSPLATGPGGPLIWALVIAHLPTVMWVRRALRRRDEREFQLAYFIQSQVQLLWLLMLAWQIGPYVPQISIGVMFGMVIGWAFQDALLSHGPPLVRAQYLIAFAIFDGTLLAFDAAGGGGLLHALRVDRQHTVSFLVAELILAGLSQLVLITVGRIAREREEEHRRAVALRVENERLSLEHRLLRRIAGLLAGGVSAGQLTHDIASPLTVLTMSVEAIELLAQSLPGEAAAEIRFACEDMHGAVGLLKRLSEATLRTIRARGELKSIEASALVDEAVELARRALQEHKGRELKLVRSLKPCAFMVSPLHAQALSNLMINGVLHQDASAELHLEGEVEGDRYVLRVRDHGIDPEERPARIAQIRGAISLVGESTSHARTGEYRGFGMGLILARTLVVSSGGTFDVEAPSDGRGLVVVLRFPLNGRISSVPLSEPPRSGREHHALTAEDSG